MAIFCITLYTGDKTEILVSNRRLNKSGQRNLTKRPHRCRTWTENRIRQLSPMCTLSNMCFLGPTRVYIPTASRSVLPFLQGSRSWQTNRPTNHATPSVTIGRIYGRSTAMRLNNTRKDLFITSALI